MYAYGDALVSSRNSLVRQPAGARPSDAALTEVATGASFR